VEVTPLGQKKKKKGGDEEELERLVTDDTFVTGKLIDNFADLKVRKQVPLRPSCKATLEAKVEG
jgi:hypothetical protein